MSYDDYSSSLILDNILYNSLNKLKLDGKVLFPMFGNKDKLIKYFEKKCKEDFPDFTIESINNFSYIIGKNNKDDLEIKEYYVFTKNKT